MKTRKVFILLMVFTLLLQASVFSAGHQPTVNENVVFEEVGQFNDGGMAVTVLIVENYAYVCEFDNGLEILDIGNPAHIIKLAQIDDTEQSRGVEILDNTAYVSCNTNGLKLYDIRDASHPVYLGQYNDRDGDPHQFLAAGDVGYLTEWHGGFDIIDISDPLKPVRLSQYKGDMLAFSLDIVGSTAFVTGYKAGLKILDISDSKNPVLMGDFSNGGETNALHVVDGKAYVCDKLQGLEILDVSDPTDPHLLGTYNGGGSTVGVYIVDKLAFVINWELGLEAIDVSDPSSPVKVGSFYDGGRPNGFQVVGDLIYIADGTDGLEIVRFRKNSDPFAQEKSKDFPVLKGPYLGQKPPGSTPQVFAPGIVSIEEGKEYKITFSPDLQEIYFTRRTPNGRNDRLWHSRLENGRLTIPKLAPFSHDCIESNACFTPDGIRLYYSSRKPLPGEETLSQRNNIWFTERTGERWSESQFLGSPINDYRPVYFSFTDHGTLYFTCSRPREICYAELKNGQFSEVKRLPDEINYLKAVAHPAVAPDGSYIIVDSYYVEDNRILGSLYISFRKPDGTWTKAVSMKEVLKASDADVYASARVTPDGKYIFFEKYIRETDKADIYWVDAKIIEDLKPKELK